MTGLPGGTFVAKTSNGLGYIDEIIRPRDTRWTIIRSLRTLKNKRQSWEEAWKDIEIVGPPKPGVTLTGRTAGYAERVGMREIDVSLTHSHTMAGASCVVRLERT